MVDATPVFGAIIARVLRGIDDPERALRIQSAWLEELAKSGVDLTPADLRADATSAELYPPSSGPSEEQVAAQARAVELQAAARYAAACQAAPVDGTPPVGLPPAVVSVVHAPHTLAQVLGADDGPIAPFPDRRKLRAHAASQLTALSGALSGTEEKEEEGEGEAKAEAGSDSDNPEEEEEEEEEEDVVRTAKRARLAAAVAASAMADPDVKYPNQVMSTCLKLTRSKGQRWSCALGGGFLLLNGRHLVFRSGAARLAFDGSAGPSSDDEDDEDE